MRIYFAASTLNTYKDLLVKNNVKNILIAFPYADSRLLKDFEDYLHKVSDVNLIIDSGAFSAWTVGQKININDYCDFCKFIKSKFEKKLNSLYFVNLDVIPGRFRREPTIKEAEESAKNGRKNYFYLLRKGIKTIPVFHQHEDLKWLKKMIKDTDFIGISPANDCSTKKRMVWMDECYNFLKNKVKTHSFGGISKKILLRYPLFSGDSSSWTAFFRFGKGIYTKYYLRPNCKKSEAYLTDKEIKEYLKLEQFITEVWKRRGVVWK